MPYTDDGFPYTNTSEDAAESLSPQAASILKLRIIRFMSRAEGATCDEVEVQFDLRHQTASARIRELVQARYIRDSGERRPTRSGRGARVYQVVDTRIAQLLFPI